MTLNEIMNTPMKENQNKINTLIESLIKNAPNSISVDKI
jgi:hypothetical protein